MALSETWVRDLTMGWEPEAYCPYDEATGEVVFGLTVIGPAPDRVIGYVHAEGQEALERVLAEPLGGHK